MKKLIPMTAFVLEQKQSNSFNERKWIDESLISLEKIRNYAKFLSQPLELGMFVPCDEKGEPIKIHSGEHIDESYPIEFQNAHSKVLFKGFYVGLYGYEKCLYNDEFLNEPLIISDLNMYTVEEIVRLSPTLTDSAIKQLGL